MTWSYGSLWIGDAKCCMARMPQCFPDMPEVRSVTSADRQIASWDGCMVQFPIDHDRHDLKYRKEVLESAGEPHLPGEGVRSSAGCAGDMARI